MAAARSSGDRLSRWKGVWHQARRAVAALGVGLLAVVGLVALPSAAVAAQNAGIVVTDVVIGAGSGPEGQLVVGDTISITGTWDASKANPRAGDTFTIGLPGELGFPATVPFELKGPRPDGSEAVWATCLADAATDVVTCTLTAEVEDFPELVHGEFDVDVEAVRATTATELVFDLNGTDTPVELPGAGGIDDGVALPDEVTKTGSMNGDNWSMSWTIDIPGANLVAAGGDVAHIRDQLGAGHVLCDPTGLTVETIRGDAVTDVTSLAEFGGAPGDTEFDIALHAPAGGFNANVVYRISYDTCTPDGEIDPEGTTYENSAQIEGWGEAGHGIGTVTNRPWRLDVRKSGSVLGGTDRNGKIAWTVEVPGDQLEDKKGFTFEEALGDGHQLCTDTISGIDIVQQYGPSSQRRENITSLLGADVVEQSAQGFTIAYTITDPDFSFKASDYRYIITYTTCVTDVNLPAGGTGYANDAKVNGVIASNTATVPDRQDEKTGRINGSTVTLDGVEHRPQTTIGWNITVPGERLTAVVGDLTVTDTIAGAHQVCAAGDPSGGLASRLGLRVEARDQIHAGGLGSIDLTDSVTVEQEGDELVFTIPSPTLPQPDGSEKTGFGQEYQYVITYTTCTSSGGMDAPGTTYGNTAVIAGKTYEGSVTQNNRGSGSGQGVTRGSIAIDKALADTPGAAFVPDDTTFTVHVKEFAPDAVEPTIEYDLQVPLDGAPVSGPNSRGTGWVIEMSEPTFPTIPGVVFGDPVFSPGAGVTVAPDGKTATAALVPGSNISVTLTNEAQLGAVSVVKALQGGASGLVSPDETFRITATIDTSALGGDFPAQRDRMFDLTVGEPLLLDNLPIGAVVTFAEAVPADDDLLTWGAPVITPESIVVTAGSVSEPAAVTITNRVERTVGTFSLVKTVTGAQAGNPAVPDAVTVTATWAESGGTEQRKQLTVPTDGTPVSFDENLLIGTEVRLTETPLADGSSIAWGAPVWSGTGVTVDRDSAVVTVGRDARATVTLENHAATSTAGLSLLKGIAGAAAGEVDPSTAFPVKATWTDADGTARFRDLTINAVEPTPLGVNLPAGTVVTITEGTQPGFDTVIWGSITISGDSVTDNADGSATVVVSDQQGDTTLVTVTNEATWAPGTFSLSKNVSGVLRDNPDVPETVTVTARWFEGGEPVSTTITVPTDGTRVPFGEDLPHGTEVTLAEEHLADAPAFTWVDPAWAAEGVVVNGDGTATITIGAAEDTAVTLTNTAVESLGSLKLVKTLAGDGAADVPAGTTFPVVATWTDLLGQEQRAEVLLTAGEPVVLDELPLGTEVTLTEGEASTPHNVAWMGATWASGDDNVAISGSGTEVVVTVTGDPGVAAAITLVNEFDTVPDLALTGGGAVGIGVVLFALVLLGGGTVLAVRRRRTV